MHNRYGEEVETVDIWVEDNGQITRNLKGIHKSLAGALRFIDRGHLVPLVGELQSVTKNRIPVQAADMFAWHARNTFREALDRPGARRMLRMCQRYGLHGTLSEDILKLVDDGFDENPDALLNPPDYQDE